MVKRVKRKPREVTEPRTNKPAGNYFSKPAEDVEFFSSGCVLLDLALGGGWAERRIANVVGNKSAGKTLLAIEASANFANKYAKADIYYREAEAAFDRSYAEALGMPIERIIFGDDKPFFTVEDMFEDMERVIKRSRNPALYIVDSLDALSDRAEQKRDIDEGSYGAAKAKKMSEMFRRQAQAMAQANVTMIIISQIRDKIGVTFGDKTSRTGGRALDFYASHVLMLKQLNRIVKKVKLIKGADKAQTNDKGDGKQKKDPRGTITIVTGINVLAQVTKNKVGLPFRDAQFPIRFGWGIDEDAACYDWLRDKVGLTDKQIPVELEPLRQLTRDKWSEIESHFLPKERKYG